MKTLTISILGLLLFSMVGVMAQENIYPTNQEIQNKYSGTPNEIQEIKQIQNQFQEKYNFICTNTCQYSKNELGQTNLQIIEQKRFLFFNIILKENYTLNEEGEITQTRYNFWSRLLNWNKLI